MNIGRANVCCVGGLECDFVMRPPEIECAYVQVALTIMFGRDIAIQTRWHHIEADQTR